MALPVSAPNATDTYSSLRTATAVLLGHAQQLQSAISSNSILPSLALNTLANAVSILAQLAAIQANPTLNAAVLALYASETGDTTDTTATAVSASAAALQTLVGAIVADFPKAADGQHLAYETFGASGVVSMDTLLASQFVQTPAALTAWLATVR